MQCLHRLMDVLPQLDPPERSRITELCAQLLEWGPETLMDAFTGYDGVSSIQCVKKDVSCVSQTEMNYGQDAVLNNVHTLPKVHEDSDRHLPKELRPNRSRGGMPRWTERNYDSRIRGHWNDLKDALEGLLGDYKKRIDHIMMSDNKRLCNQGVPYDVVLNLGDDKRRKRSRELHEEYGPPLKIPRQQQEQVTHIE